MWRGFTALAEFVTLTYDFELSVLRSDFFFPSTFGADTGPIISIVRESYPHHIHVKTVTITGDHS